MVTSGDANGDGLIDYSEFRTAMLSSENPLWQSVNDGMQKVVVSKASADGTNCVGVIAECVSCFVRMLR